MSSRSVPQTAPARAFTSGELLAERYRLVRRVGEGAMGTVWVAHNEVLDVDVAVKVLRIGSNRTDVSRAYKRLLREARATARLGHPGIVRVFDFGQTEDGSPYIVMELLEGESLAEQLTRQPRLGMVEAVQLLLPIIDALSVAHDRGIVHRDIKPENIFLSRDQYGRVQPKIVDFGVARLAEAGRSLTRAGALLGTPDYMAPEQARGELGIDHRVDLWAICIVLYELLTGRRPFARDATNYLAVLRAIVHDRAPSIRNYGAGDDALWLIIERGLKKRAADRWGTMRELGEALALWLYEQGAREDVVGASLKTTWLQAGRDGVKIEAPSVRPPGPLLTVGRPKPPPPPPSPKNADIEMIQASLSPARLVEESTSEIRGLATLLEPAPAPAAEANDSEGAPPPAPVAPRRRLRGIAMVASMLAVGAVTAMFVRRAGTESVVKPASAPVSLSTEATKPSEQSAAALAVEPETPQGAPAATVEGREIVFGEDPPAVAPPPAQLEVSAAAAAPPRTKRPSAPKIAPGGRLRAASTGHRGALPSARTYDFGF